jgi:hypothetical protein
MPRRMLPTSRIFYSASITYRLTFGLTTETRRARRLTEDGKNYLGVLFTPLFSVSLRALRVSVVKPIQSANRSLPMPAAPLQIRSET